MKTKNIILTFVIALLTTTYSLAQPYDYDKDNCEKYRSLYFQYLKQNMYRDAMNFWSMAYDYCGKTDSLDAKFFMNGRIGYYKLYSSTEDATTKSQLRDTLYWIYEQLIITDPTNMDWQAKYATMLVNEDDTRFDKIDSLYQTSLHSMRGESSAADITKYFKHLITNRFNKAPADKKEDVRAFIIEEYMKLSEYCAEGASKNRAGGKEDDAKRYDDAQEFMDKYFLMIVNDCTVLVDVVEKKLGSLPQAKDAKQAKVNAYLGLLDKKKCQSTPTYAKLLDTLIAVEPNANAYFKTGIYYMENDQAEKAVQYFEKAVELEGDGANKNDYLYYLATAQYSAKKYRAAYSTAKMVEGDKKGKAMKICGDAIAAMANSCGDTTFERKANYWLANDYYRKAAALGEDVSTSKYLDNAPSETEIFENSQQKGASITLSCWGESTVIR